MSEWVSECVVVRCCCVFVQWSAEYNVGQGLGQHCTSCRPVWSTELCWTSGQRSVPRHHCTDSVSTRPAPCRASARSVSEYYAGTSPCKFLLCVATSYGTVENSCALSVIRPWCFLFVFTKSFSLIMRMWATCRTLVLCVLLLYFSQHHLHCIARCELFHYTCINVGCQWLFLCFEWTMYLLGPRVHTGATWPIQFNSVWWSAVAVVTIATCYVVRILRWRFI